MPKENSAPGGLLTFLPRGAWHQEKGRKSVCPLALEAEEFSVQVPACLLPCLWLVSQTCSVPFL
jgi:hypothetical protein